ncbi:RidA family protein [Mitsuaria sp. GD03876]|uniref:RidA family protein n=1 Tax=Mitsuaria sp. GD03876 TaxID=2975399 RepID=UPI00244CF25A|nr:RidA family protein [Mitsuaria sp. GD03876]MDH0867551.1 RidA family protein [Mitsuaria sp. GD03876]
MEAADAHLIELADSEALSPPAGHCSHVSVAAGLAFISGMLPIDREGTPLKDASFETQTRQVLANLEAALDRVGLTPRDLLQVRVYITDIAQWPAFNRLYAEWIGSHRPARAVAGVAELHYGLAVEVEAVALAGLTARCDPLDVRPSRTSPV